MSVRHPPPVVVPSPQLQHKTLPVEVVIMRRGITRQGRPPYRSKAP
jgi:hypothetical protein